jgi:hypothetical protein
MLFSEFMARSPASRVLFEACGTAHHLSAYSGISNTEPTFLYPSFS